jgi:hypothetical protein
MGKEWDITLESLKFALAVVILLMGILFGLPFSIAVVVAVFRMAGC